jgi:hypothetical protein
MGCGCGGKKLTKEQRLRRAMRTKERKLVATKKKRQRNIRKLYL